MKSYFWVPWLAGFGTGVAALNLVFLLTEWGY